MICDKAEKEVIFGAPFKQIPKGSVGIVCTWMSQTRRQVDSSEKNSQVQEINGENLTVGIK